MIHLCKTNWRNKRQKKSITKIIYFCQTLNERRRKREVLSKLLKGKNMETERSHDHIQSFFLSTMKTCLETDLVWLLRHTQAIQVINGEGRDHVGGDGIRRLLPEPHHTIEPADTHTSASQTVTTKRNTDVAWGVVLLKLWPPCITMRETKTNSTIIHNKIKEVI